MQSILMSLHVVLWRDLRDIAMKEDDWYKGTRRSRQSWRALYGDGVEKHRKMKTAQTQAPAVARDVVCEVYGRKFSDRKRHNEAEKCGAIKHVRQQYIANCPSEQYACPAVHGHTVFRVRLSPALSCQLSFSIIPLAMGK